MALKIYQYVSDCISWLPNQWIALIIGMLGLASAEALFGLIDRAWRIIGR